MAPGRITVYIIDDDSSVRRALGRVMTSAGLEWKSFGSFEDFLAAGEPDGAGCIIMDPIVPGLDRVDLKQQSDVARLQLPLIILTANDTEEAHVSARVTKAVAFFRKPVDSDALLDAVRWATRSANGKGNEEHP